MRYKYYYTLTITKHENNLVEGSLKLSDISEQQYYVIFKLNITFKNEVLTIKTDGKNNKEPELKTWLWKLLFSKYLCFKFIK